MNNLKYICFLAILSVISCKNNREKSCVADDVFLDSEFKNIPYSNRFPSYINTSSGLKYKILSREKVGDSIFKDDILLVNYKILIDAKLLFKNSNLNQRFLVKDYGFYLPRLTSVLSYLKVGDSVNIFIPKGYYSKKDGVLADIENNDILFSIKFNKSVAKYSYFNTGNWNDVNNGIKVALVKPITEENKTFKTNELVEMYYAVYIDGGDSIKLVESNFEALNPLVFSYGEYPFIEGLNMILPTIKHKQKMKVKIPSFFAYGEKGTNIIPPNSDLIFDIEIK